MVRSFFFRSQWYSHRSGNKAIATTPHCMDQIQIRIQFLEFVSDPVYMNGDGRGLAQAVVLLNPIKQLFLAKDFVRVAG